jgi:hypothetical protein
LSYVSGNNKTELFMEGNWTGVFGLILQWWSYTKNMGNRCWRDAIRQDLVSWWETCSLCIMDLLLFILLQHIEMFLGWILISYRICSC